MNVDVFISRPVMAAVLSIVICVLGLVSLPRLGVQETPEVSSPIVTVQTTYPGAAPAVVEADVTEPLERELNAIEGLSTISSESRDQASVITLEFDVGRDLEAAANDVRDRVARAIRDLPDDVDAPVVRKEDGDPSAVMYLRIVGDRSLLELTDLADTLVRERLERISGVSSVDIYGERRYAMRVEIDPIALAARGLTATDVQAALVAANVEAPAGRVESHVTDIPVRMTEGLQTPAQFEDVVLRQDEAGVLRLRDVARVRIGAEDERSAARSDGVPSLSVAVQPQTGANIVAISDEIRRRVPDLRADLPDDLELEINYDRSIPVRKSIADVVLTLAVSATLVLLVILAFLRSVRATLVPAVAIVVSLVGTLTMMLALGLTLNVFTLFGLVLAIGLVVDDAIVVLENIWRHIEEGVPPLQAATEGTREIVFPVLATTISLVAVFLPVVFAGGSSGRLFFEFGLTVGTAVVLSTVVALTASPALCGRLLRPRGEGPEGGGRLARAFAATAAPIVSRPGAALLVVLGTIGAGAWMLANTPTEFFPLEDRNFFMVRLTGPEGVGFEWMDARVRELEPEMMDLVPERTGLLSRVSSGRGGLPGAANSGMFAIPLVPPAQRERSQGDIVRAVRGALSDVTAMRVIPIQRPTVGRGRGSSIEVVLQHDDQDVLAQHLDDYVEAVRALDGITDVDVDLRLNRPEVAVRVDRAAAARTGVALAEVARALQLLSSGLEIDTFRRGTRQYPVLLALQSADRSSTTDLASIQVRAADGGLVPLSTLVSWHEEAAASSRYHHDRAPSATVSAAPDGIALGPAVERVRAAADALPEGFRTALAGSSKDLAESNSTLTQVFALALVLVFLVLAAQFDSFLDPLPILLSLPVAVAAGLVPLWVLGEPLSFFGQVGLVLLVGLVTKNGILIVEFAGQRLAEGVPPHEAALEAARLRLRPILMTTTSTVGGALPIALGASGATRASLGMVVVGGMLASTVLSLYATPAVWAWLRSRRPRPAPIVAVVVALLALPTLAQAQPLGLDDVLKDVVAQAPATQVAEADVVAAQRAVGEARGAAMPELSVSGRAQYGNTFVAGGTGVGGDASGIVSVTGRLAVDVLAPATWAAIGIAARDADVVGRTSDDAILTTQRDAADAWLDLQRATGAWDVALAARRRSEALRDVAVDLEDVGRGIHLDVVRAEVQVRRDELLVITTRRDVAVALAQLEATLGRDLGDDVRALVATLPEPGDDVRLDERPDVAAADAAAAAVIARRKAAGWSLAPTLQVYGEAGGLVRTGSTWAPTTAVGASFTWSPIAPSRLFQLGRLAAERDAAELRAALVRATAEAERDTARADLAAAREAWTVAEEALALADEEVALAMDLYQEGAGSQVDVLDAQVRRATVARERLDALVAFNRAVVAGCAAQGTFATLGGR